MRRAALILVEYQNEWLSPQGKLNCLMQDRAQFERSIAASVVAIAAIPAAATVPAVAPPADSDPGRSVAVRCKGCHGYGAYATKQHTRLAWHLIVLRMELLHGADLRAGERSSIVDHLAASSRAPIWRVLVEGGTPGGHSCPDVALVPSAPARKGLRANSRLLVVKGLDRGPPLSGLCCRENLERRTERPQPFGADRLFGLHRNDGIAPSKSFTHRGDLVELCLRSSAQQRMVRGVRPPGSH